MSILTVVSDLVSEVRQIETLSKSILFSKLVVLEPELLLDAVNKIDVDELRKMMFKAAVKHQLYDLLSKNELKRICAERKIKVRSFTKQDVIRRLKCWKD